MMFCYLKHIRSANQSENENNFYNIRHCLRNRDHQLQTITG